MTDHGVLFSEDDLRCSIPVITGHTGWIETTFFVMFNFPRTIEPENLSGKLYRHYNIPKDDVDETIFNLSRMIETHRTNTRSANGSGVCYQRFAYGHPLLLT